MSINRHQSPPRDSALKKLVFASVPLWGYSFLGNLHTPWYTHTCAATYLDRYSAHLVRVLRTLEFRNSLPVPVVHAVASMSSDLISRDLAAHVLAASTVMVHISKIWAIFFQRSQRFSTLSMARVAVPPKLPQTASRRMHIDRLHWHQSNRLHELSTTICDSRTAVPIRSSYHTQGMH